MLHTKFMAQKGFLFYLGAVLIGANIATVGESIASGNFYIWKIVPGIVGAVLLYWNSRR